MLMTLKYELVLREKTEHVARRVVNESKLLPGLCHLALINLKLVKLNFCPLFGQTVSSVSSESIMRVFPWEHNETDTRSTLVHKVYQGASQSLLAGACRG